MQNLTNMEEHTSSFWITHVLTVFSLFVSACSQSVVFDLAGWAMLETTSSATLGTPSLWPRHSVSDLLFLPDVKKKLQCFNQTFNATGE